MERYPATLEFLADVHLKLVFSVTVLLWYHIEAASKAPEEFTVSPFSGAG